MSLYSDLGSCLKAISTQVPPFDRERLASLIAEAIRLQLLEEATRSRFEIKDVLDTDITAFRTAQPDRLAVDYTVTTRFEVDPSVEETNERTHCRAITQGSCYYDVAKDCLSGHFIEDITFSWKYVMGGRGSVSRSLGNEDPSIPFRRPMRRSW